MSPELASLLGRWHQWRRRYSHERQYARVALLHSEHDTDAEDELERMLMRTLEAEIEAMPADLKLALQHVARAECMGVEVITAARLMQRDKRERLVDTALRALERRLLFAGVL